MRRASLAVLTIALAVVPSTLAGCSDDESAHAGHGDHATTAAPGDAPDRVIAGPQGAVAQFVVECGFSHAAFDDPIVHPGEPGASHLHVFFGNDGTDAFSTVESLAGGGTTCNQSLDLASYWAPALIRDGVVQTPVKSVAYYRAGIDVAPATVEPYPYGLRMVAGDMHATDAQPLAVVAWTCGAGSLREAVPPACPAERNLRLLVTFPDCWNGVDLDSDDHVSHVAYSHRGACPSTHPVPVPQLQFSVEYPVTGSIDGLELSSGGLLTGHADFYNAWDEARLAREVRNCLHRDVVCGVASGRTDG
ncbi:MAG: DUF1996 domain-containing protein [Acidimicrobiales bacterium]|nr:DUF1996 domain-containing protein [Acidimicrobiales bacterium]MCB9395363.1 DUF1996 domain-containing protein [Acidimicrobiaceae bacterium]